MDKIPKPIQNVSESGMTDPLPSLPNMQGCDDEILEAQPRPVDANGQASESPSIDSAAAESGPRRQVSSNACEPCRRRKSKCDGMKPFCLACSVLHMTACTYDLNKDLRRKGALRQEIQRLKKRSENYQFVIDSLCLAEEPRLGQLKQLVQSGQSIEVIADTWRSNGFAPLDQWRQAPSRYSAGVPPLMEMATNQTNITISQSGVQSNQPNININGSNIQINQPAIPMPSILGIAGTYGDRLDFSGVIPGQPSFPRNKLDDAKTSTGAENTLESPININGWYDEWGQLWPTL